MPKGIEVMNLNTSKLIGRQLIRNSVLFLTAFLLLVGEKGRAQRPEGKFLQDTIEIGKPFYYSFSYLHSPDTEVFFPDTTFNFFPFEVVGQEYFTTQTSQRGSLDSTVYKLVAFNVQREQVFSLPVFVSLKGDCTTVFSMPDTAHLDLLMAPTDRPDTLQLRVLNDVIPLEKQFDYIVFVGFLVSAALVGLIIFWLFGEILKRQWNMFLLQRRHGDFVRSFSRLTKSANEKGILVDAEKAVIVWKNFMEKVEEKPFATYTTREILDTIDDESLATALKDMDGVIYGQVKSSSMVESLEVLKRVGLRAYRIKRKEIADSGKVTAGQ
jgi:hypothetical protein